MSLSNKEQTLFLRDSTLFLLKDGVEYEVSNPEIIAFNFVPPYEWPGNIKIVHQIKDSTGWVTAHELMYSKFPDDRRRIVARLLPKEKKEMDHSMDAVPYMLGGIPDKGAMSYSEGDYKKFEPIGITDRDREYIAIHDRPKPFSAPVESQEELWESLMEEWREVSLNMQSPHILPYLMSKFKITRLNPLTNGETRF